MSNKIITSAFLVAALLLLSVTLTAQVTIGTDKPPITGALLELTEGATTTKGLGLPRVDLDNINSLNPCIPGTAADDPGNKKIHTGLMVYNIKEIVTAKEIKLCKGVHVWNGSNWDPLIPYPEVIDPMTIDRSKYLPDTKTITDVRGAETNVYEVGYFARVDIIAKPSCDPKKNTFEVKVDPNGQWWTLENMRATLKRNGTPFTGQGPFINPAINYGDASIPGMNPSPITVKSPADLNTGNPIKFGENQNSDIPMLNMSLSRKEFVKIFGIMYSEEDKEQACPQGWKTPTPRNSEDLVYSMSTTPKGTLLLNTDGALFLRANRHYYTASSPINTGKHKLTSIKWGVNDAEVVSSKFKAYPSGYVLYITPTLAPSIPYYAGSGFSQASSTWGASGPNQNLVILYESQGVNIGGPPSISVGPSVPFLAVRCVKDGL